VKLYKPRNLQSEQSERDRRAVSRGKIVKGPMFRQKPLNQTKAKIEELVD
jgi:hypothetical protein